MLLRWDPFRELDRLADEMWKGADTGPMRIPMDALKRDGSVEIHFELPGFDADDIAVDVDRNVLSVSAERTVTEERTEGEEVLVRERRHGRFLRQVTLGDDLDTEHLEARYDNGVLTVSVPVVEQAKSRRVEVTRGKGDEPAPAIETTGQEASGGDHTHAA
jgi:HSP20 family protein